MRILVACERSGIVREAFRAMGHETYSCDLERCEDGRSDFHIWGDVLSVLDAGWDLMIAHPECRYICGSGLHWNKRRPGREKLTEQALDFAEALWNAPIARICIENPVGALSRRIGWATQYIQPFWFGSDASKRTGLWLKHLSPLQPTRMVEPRRIWIDGKEYDRWANQTDSGQNRLGPSDTRSMDRARTYPGIAAAMAKQWGRLSAFRQPSLPPTGGLWPSEQR